MDRQLVSAFVLPLPLNITSSELLPLLAVRSPQCCLHHGLRRYAEVCTDQKGQ